MATITRGFGVAHSTQIHLPPEIWPSMGEGDKRNPMLVGPDGLRHTYEELLPMAPADVAAALQPEEQRARHQRCQDGIARVAELIAGAPVDVLVAITDDEYYLFSDQMMPAYYIFWGPSYSYIPTPLPENASPILKAAAWAYGLEPVELRGAPELGEHLVRQITDEGFDLTAGKTLNSGTGIGRPYGFLNTRVLGGKRPAGGLLPIILNASYGPNLAAPGRAYDFGLALAQAILSWESDARVGIVAVGNFSHPVLDEAMDRRLFQAVRSGDSDTLCSLPRPNFEGGNGQARTWIAAAAALEGLTMHAIDYVACYRSEAGTGCGMPFAWWE